jgi:hypothetical protein
MKTVIVGVTLWLEVPVDAEEDEDDWDIIFKARDVIRTSELLQMANEFVVNEYDLGTDSDEVLE